MSRRISFLLSIAAILLAWTAWGPTESATASSCTHYASPTGSGSGISSANPFKIAHFWPLAKPGYVLCLLDGEYTGSASMINPPQNLNGTATAPIVIRALNDGKVTINGQRSLIPVRLRYNNYFVLEGFNAHSSSGNVITMMYSSYNIVRRVVAWDAADGNTQIFGAHHGTNNLFEDVAGFGIARKIFGSSQSGNYTIFRRAWGRWEGSHVVGPKMTYSLAYNNHHLICENCIGTWSGERMKSTYTLLDYYGKPWTGNGAGTYTNYAVNQPYAIFGVDALTGTDKNAHNKLLGSIAYIHGKDRFHAPQAVFVTKLDSIEVRDSAVYIQPGYHTTKYRFALYNLQTSRGLNLRAEHLTGIGGKGSYYGSEWKRNFLSEGSSASSVGNVFTSDSGARLCYRYKDGVLTNEPLWPWPMNQRIIDATTASGRAGVDVTKVVESMFGTIPANCKTTTAIVSPAPTPAPAPAVTVPSAPSNLRISP